MKRILTCALCLFMLLGLALPLGAGAEESGQKVVRVGWYESTYCYRDQNGERRGIAYEYQMKIAAHTGWAYEYVEDSWPNLLQMLIDGEIDLLSDVSFKPEREELMLFPALAMGAESYYIYIDANNAVINPEDAQTLGGKRIGVNKGSFQEGLLAQWAEENGVAIEIVEMDGDEAYSMVILAQGEIDALVSMDSFGAQERVVPVTKIGASEYYIAVNKARPDLLAELNGAMSAILDEDPYYNQRLFDAYVHLTKTNAFLRPSLEEWLKAHGAIRVGYWDDYMPFCATNAQTGELDGALKDYLAHAATRLKNADIRFEATPYPSTDAALSAMKRGEIDCVFPINMSTSSGEASGMLTTNPIMQTEMSLLMRAEDRPEIAPGSALTVAIDAGNANYETLIKENMPNWTIVSCPDVEACFRAVESGKADGVVASNYRMAAYEPLRAKYKLVALPTGESMGMSFAVSMDRPELYSILNKIVNLSSSENTVYALAGYMYSGQKVSVMAFLEDHWIGVVVLLSAVFIVIIVLLIQKLKAERTADEQRRLLEEAAEIAKLKQTITSLLDNMPGMNFTKDAQTGVYLACNQTFAAYARKRKPEEVVGLTDADIFDAETTERFAEDDRMALSMDKPYVFFEDVRDAAGERRQIKTTRLKYTDTDGRLCVLGISVDVTMDTAHIHRETASNKEAYEKARTAGVIYTHIAQALARGYADLYYINLDTEGYIEYRTDEESGTLTEARRGWHFFEQCQLEVGQLVYPEDRDSVLRALDRKALVAALDRNNSFIMTYRLIGEQGPHYVSMKVTRMKDDDRYIVLGVTDVDDEAKQRAAASRMKEEKIAYARLGALAGDFLCIYIVEPQTGRYREFSATAGFESFDRPREGQDFFADSRAQSRTVIYPEDQNRFTSMLTRESVLKDVERHGIFTLSYRLMLEGKPRYVQLKAVMLEEKEGPRLIVGVNDIDNQVRQEEAYLKNLAQAQISASVDALTGVKNRHAYLTAEERLNTQIAEGRAPAFAIVVLDVNDLKEINDTSGHEAGDQHIRSACKIICNTFKHSPVFRIGGDEFAVIAQGDDYAALEALMARMDEQNAEAQRTGGVVIACGMSRHADDASVAPVFERADQNMYGNKSGLKAGRK
ncbi:MAG: transporter substrate-binding domain-containing protein [Clostridia bacterium]|nr:transporter substrate-binding domain-containing protein [Clostridia bacterium]